MKGFKVLFAVLILSIFLFQPNNSKSGTSSGSKEAELSFQLVEEIKEALKFPLLKYESKNLTGEVKVFVTVEKNGKINFKDIKGLNENLTDNVKAKLNSLNLWTSPDYSESVFQYNIKYKN